MKIGQKFWWHKQLLGARGRDEREAFDSLIVLDTRCRVGAQGNCRAADGYVAAGPYSIRLNVGDIEVDLSAADYSRGWIIRPKDHLWRMYIARRMG
jgi:hypothetical protein